MLLDWYLANAELGDAKFSIKANVSGPDLGADGRTVKITEWKPYALDNLRNGDYKISLELDDKDGKAVAGAWNSTTRTITINRDAPEDPAPTPPAVASDKDKKKDEKAEAKDKKKEEKAEAKDKKNDYSEQESNFVLATIMLGKCWQRLGRDDLAHANFDRARELRPELADLASFDRNQESNLLHTLAGSTIRELGLVPNQP